MYIVLILLKAFSQCSHNLAKINCSKVVTSLTMTQGYINLVSLLIQHLDKYCTNLIKAFLQCYHNLGNLPSFLQGCVNYISMVNATWLQ